MILPAGHVNTELRRFPWLTSAIVVACLAVFLHTELGSSKRDARLETVLEQARGYLEQKPYLEIADEDAALLFPELSPAEANSRLEELRAGYPYRVFEFQLTMDQPELDRRLEEAKAALASDPFRVWGLIPASPESASWLTHLFFHESWVRMLLGVLFLFMAGYALEEVWGRVVFAALFLCAGIGSAALFVATHAGQTAPLIGVAGATAALMGAFTVRFGTTPVRFWYLLPLLVRFPRGSFCAPGWLMLAPWLGLEVGWPWLASEGSAGLVEWSRLSAGFGVGAVAALGLRLSGVEKRYLRPALEAKVPGRENKAVAKALELREAGELKDAFGLLAETLRRNALDGAAGLALWEVAKELEREEEAAPLLIPLLKRDVQNGHIDAALRQITEFAEHVPDLVLDPALLSRMATQLVAAKRTEHAGYVLARSLCSPRPLAAPLALRLVQIARPLDAALAGEIAAHALRADDLDPELRLRLEDYRRAGAPSRPSALESPSEAEQNAAAFDHGAVDLSASEEASPAPESSREPVVELFDHGVVDLSSDDAPAEQAVPADDGPTTPLERQSTFELGSEGDGELDFLGSDLDSIEEPE